MGRPPRGVRAPGRATSKVRSPYRKIASAAASLNSAPATTASPALQQTAIGVDAYHSKALRCKCLCKDPGTCSDVQHTGHGAEPPTARVATRSSLSRPILSGDRRRSGLTMEASLVLLLWHIPPRDASALPNGLELRSPAAGPATLAGRSLREAARRKQADFPGLSRMRAGQAPCPMPQPAGSASVSC